MIILKTKIRDIVSIVIFLVLVSASVFLVRPVFNRLTAEVTGYALEKKSELEEKLSLKISYKALSPSILSSVSINDVSLTTMDGEEVAQIDRIRLDYKLFRLIKGDFVNGFKSLQIEGMSLEGYRLLNIFGTSDSSETKTKSNKPELDWKQISKELARFKAEIPVSVIFKNVTFSYLNEEKQLDARVNIKKMTVDYVKRSNQLVFVADAQASTKYKENTYSGNLNLDGKLFDGFENSSANISLSSMTDGNLRLNKMNFYLGYANNSFTLSTIKNTIPFSLSALFNLADEKAQLSIKTNELSLSNLVTARRQNKILKKYGGFNLTTDTSLHAENKRDESGQSDLKLGYKSKTKAFIPEEFIPSGANVSFDVSGDLNKAVIKSLSVLNKDYDVSGNLELAFKKMTASGYLDVASVNLPGGTNISGEIYIDPLERGFMAFIPQIYIDENYITAVELTAVPHDDSVDFAFEGYDYSHYEAEDPGKISGDGSFLLNEKYVQASLSINSYFVDSVLNTAASFLDEKGKESVLGMTDTFKDFMFSGDSYLSTDFKTFSFNVPYVLLANTVEENQALYLSLDGNSQGINVSQADLVWGKNAVHLSGAMESVPETKENFLILDLNTGDIPYHFAGKLTDQKLQLAGDYGSEILLNFGGNDGLNGTVSWMNFPVSVQKLSLFSSLDSNFAIGGEDGVTVNINRLDIEDSGNMAGFKPRVSLSGYANKYGAKFSKITYSDLYSEMDGSADVVLSMEGGIPSYAGLTLNLKNPIAQESVSLNATVSNPDNKEFSVESLKKDYVMDVSAIVKRFGMNRFAKVKSSNNELSLSVSATGTIDSPYVSVSLDNLSLMNSGDLMKMTGSAVLEDKLVSIHDFNFKFMDYNVNQVYGSFSLDSFTGIVNANVDGLFIGESFHVPFEVEVMDVSRKDGSFIPEDLTVELRSKDVYGSLFKKKLDFTLTGMISNGVVTLNSSENLGLFAFFAPEGDFFAEMNCNNIAKMKLSGDYEKGSGKIDAYLSDVVVDMKNLFSVINFDSMVLVYGGILSGDIKYTGTLDNPVPEGVMILNNAVINIPVVMKEKLSTDNLILNFSTGEIDIPEKVFICKKNTEVYASCKILFDKWKYDHLEANVRTLKGKFVPVYIADAAKKMIITGDGNMDLDMVLTNEDFFLTGNVLAEKAELFLNLAKMLTAVPGKPAKIPFNMSINVNLGTHVRVAVDPLLRAIFVPGQKLKVGLDGNTGALTLDGNLILKSGDVSYLNRNFYIKEGSLKFTEADDGFNPLVNIVAETRERDEKGDQVTISLIGINQYFASFTPKFSSIPAKSEAEIQQILGQIVVADSESVGNFLFAAGDYAIQSLVGRKFENTLRDFFNFDIFSLRTNIIQNTLNMSFQQNKSGETFSAGNFFDNSTVYIGKYLGTALYLDAMLNLQYDDKRVRDATTVGGMIFRPEFGMELESPFGNIRWNVAPDIDALLHKQYVPSSSVSLSWKFSF